MTVNEKIALLRTKMAQNNIDAYIVCTADNHLSEYIPEYFRFRKWLCGFSGSAGTFALTMHESGLWTDGRYYIQAERELSGSEVALHKAYEVGVKGYVDYLCDALKEGARVGIDGALISRAARDDMQKKFAAKNIELDAMCDFSDIWQDRPPLSCEKAFCLDMKYAGESAKDKIERVRDFMRKEGVDYAAFSMLDCVMWLFNIRGADIANCPTAISHALIAMDEAKLYIQSAAVDASLKETLSAEGVTVLPYEDFTRDIAAIDEAKVLGIPFARTNSQTSDAAKCTVRNIRDCVTEFKAKKNETENAALRECYIEDTAALARAFCRVEDAVNAGEEIYESDVSDILIEERAKSEFFLYPSFDTIAAYGANAAMMHYFPKKDDCARLEKKGMLLVDSGGQYCKGTTDITRTLVLGDLSEEEKRSFTLVAKGNMSLARARFLRGTAGANLDILARLPLWMEGIDYKCGTGHGVGFCLNVHEGPQNFSQNLRSTALECGMNLTIEPGVYKEGCYGIRTENDVIVVPFTKTSDGEFYRFEMLSYFPIDTRAIIPEMLSADEKAWLNDYHEKTYTLLAPHLCGRAKEWLFDATRAIN